VSLRLDLLITPHASPFIDEGGMHKGIEPRYVGPTTNGRMELLLAQPV
jgi:hypothetical protein